MCFGALSATRRKTIKPILHGPPLWLIGCTLVGAAYLQSPLFYIRTVPVPNRDKTGTSQANLDIFPSTRFESRMFS